MSTMQTVAGVVLILAGAFLLGNSAMAVDPDHVRESTRPQVQTREKSDQPPPPAAGLSEAFKKYQTTRMLTWRASVSGSITFMGQFNSEAHCVAAQKMLQRQLVRWGWGRAQCLEILLPQ